MQFTITLQHREACEQFDCRVAAMARMVALMDSGTPFEVTYAPHDAQDAQAIRHVTLWDEYALRGAIPNGWQCIEGGPTD